MSDPQNLQGNSDVPATGRTTEFSATKVASWVLIILALIGVVVSWGSALSHNTNCATSTTNTRIEPTAPPSPVGTPAGPAPNADDALEPSEEKTACEPRSVTDPVFVLPLALLLLALLPFLSELEVFGLFKLKARVEAAESEASEATERSAETLRELGQLQIQLAEVAASANATAHGGHGGSVSLFQGDIAAAVRDLQDNDTTVLDEDEDSAMNRLMLCKTLVSGLPAAQGLDPVPRMIVWMPDGTGGLLAAPSDELYLLEDLVGSLAVQREAVSLPAAGTDDRGNYYVTVPVYAPGRHRAAGRATLVFPVEPADDAETVDRQVAASTVADAIGPVLSQFRPGR